MFTRARERIGSVIFREVIIVPTRALWIHMHEQYYYFFTVDLNLLLVGEIALCKKFKRLP